MRRMLVVAVALAVVVILLSVPSTQAQPIVNGYVPQEWGYVHQAMASTRYNLTRMWDGYHEENARIWADSNRREYESQARRYGVGYYGVGGYYPSYNPYGSGYYGSYGYPWTNRYGDRGRFGYRHGATQDNVNTWGAINLGAQVVGTVVSEVRADRRHNREMAAIRDSERNIAAIQEERAAQVMETRPASVPLTTVVNATGECLQVNGVILEKAARLTVQDPQTMQVATESSSSCKVQAEGIGEYILLTCRK